MRRSIPTFRLLVLAGCAVIALILVETRCTQIRQHPDYAEMKEAESLALYWNIIVSEKKKELGIVSQDLSGDVASGPFTGDEWSDITTTLGSLEAKELASDPAFAALAVRLLREAGIDSSDCVGVMVSGSFPSISTSVLAALQTIGAHVLLVSSLGASSYGANQPMATWADMESWLHTGGGLKYHSAIVTFGGEGDTGGGISDEGKEMLRAAIERTHAPFYHPLTLDSAISCRMHLFFGDRPVSLLINIGGSQAGLGACSHASTIPNGYHRNISTCDDPDRGVLSRASEAGVPVIHFLNIRSLAARTGLRDTDMQTGEGGDIYYVLRRDPYALSVSLVLLAAGILALRPRRQPS
jgi:poly-gamma-glutamate system protein